MNLYNIQISMNLESDLPRNPVMIVTGTLCISAGTRSGISSSSDKSDMVKPNLNQGASHFLKCLKRCNRPKV